MGVALIECWRGPDFVDVLSCRCCEWLRCCGGGEPRPRTVWLGHPEKRDQRYPRNVVNNQKYNFFTFLPGVCAAAIFFPRREFVPWLVLALADRGFCGRFLSAVLTTDPFFIFCGREACSCRDVRRLPDQAVPCLLE